MNLSPEERSFIKARIEAHLRKMIVEGAYRMLALDKFKRLQREEDFLVRQLRLAQVYHCLRS